LIIESLVRAVDLFKQHGLRAFTKDWERLDLVSGRTVELHHEQEPMIKGVARGIDARGALLIERDGMTRSYHAGEVSIRLS
jgi:BirA family biotin operon repressor/biotin-[acetyl-CoA-carboxylase] ligase